MSSGTGCIILQLKGKADIVQHVDDAKLWSWVQSPREISITREHPIAQMPYLLPALTHLEAALPAPKFLEASGKKCVTHCLLPTVPFREMVHLAPCLTFALINSINTLKKKSPWLFNSYTDTCLCVTYTDIIVFFVLLLVFAVFLNSNQP